MNVHTNRTPAETAKAADAWLEEMRAALAEEKRRASLYNGGEGMRRRIAKAERNVQIALEVQKNAHAALDL